MSPKIILLNGPPHCGKDTIGNQLWKLTNQSSVVKFATPLKTVATHLYCNGDRDLFDKMDAPEQKGKPDELFFGKSCRQVQIDISESYAKPMHGPRVFGKILASTIKQRMATEQTRTFFVTDSGFLPEAEELVDQFGRDNVILIRIHRDGKTFDGDSRSYINLDLIGVTSLDVNNVEGEAERTVTYINNILKPFLQE